MRLQLIAFNLGSLGFLTNHFYQNYIRDLKGVIYGRESLDQCSMDTDEGMAVSLLPTEHGPSTANLDMSCCTRQLAVPLLFYPASSASICCTATAVSSWPRDCWTQNCTSACCQLPPLRTHWQCKVDSEDSGL